MVQKNGPGNASADAPRAGITSERRLLSNPRHHLPQDAIDVVPRFIGRAPARDAAPVMSPETAAKIAKILGMIGSAHDGEALAAARMANSMVKAAGVQWADVIVDARALPAPAKVSDLEMAEAVADNLELFDEKSVAFVVNILPWLRRGHGLSDKQERWLSSLYQSARIARRRP
jgi:hypothetical protein